MTDLTLRLNPDHDVAQYARDYQRDGLIRIQNLFPDDIADGIYQVLSRATPWHLVHSDAQGAHAYYRPHEWDSKPGPEKQKLIQDTLIRARDGFAYLYFCYPMIDALLEKRDPDWQLHALTEFMNSDEMLDFTRTVTGEPSVIKHDAQATQYSRGHFLNIHDDTGTKAERRAAYVMGFSKNWRSDWGGHLLFLDGDDVEQGFAPSFNTLTLFKVPRRHVVTQVTNFAGAGRFSVTGWLRDDP